MKTTLTNCNRSTSCGHFSLNPKLNHCDPVKCEMAIIRAINATKGDN